MKPQQTDWVVFTVDAESIDVRVSFVLCTQVSEEKLKELLDFENRKRCYYGKPTLRYAEFDPAPKNPQLGEAERQFLRGEGIGRDAEFENLVCDLLKEPGRTTSGITSTAGDEESKTGDEESIVWIKAADWAFKHGDKRQKDKVLKRLSKARERSWNTGRKYKGRDILLDGNLREYFDYDKQDYFYNEQHLDRDKDSLFS